MAIIAIIAAAALPALVSQIDYAAQTTEAANLGALAAGLTQGSSRQRWIPNQTDWGTFIATNIGWQVNAVLINAANNPRVFLIDPKLVIGTTTPNPAALPYVQTYSGSGNNQPPCARFIILSSLSNPLSTAGLSSGVPTSTDFDALWNNPDNTVPTGTTWNWNPWKDHGADIKIQRVNLGASFNLLTLTVLDTVNPPYSIDSSFVMTNTPVNAYFLKSTVVNLYYYTNQPPAANNIATQASQVLLQDSSWVFSGGLWRIAPMPAYSQSIVQNFYTNTPNPMSLMAPATIYNDMINYMGRYLQYAASGFANPAARLQLTNASVTLSTDIGLIITRPP